MSKFGYEHKYLCLRNSKGEIIGATLLLIKKIKHIFKYAYAPKGFLVNYRSEKELSLFTEEIKKYARKEKIIFIKINPEIPTYKIDEDLKKTQLSNYTLIDLMESRGYVKLKNNLYFESMLPRFNAILDLENLNKKNFSKTTKNRINNAKRKGLEIEIHTDNKVKDLFPFIANKKKRRTIKYYNNYFNIFADEGNAEIKI